MTPLDVTDPTALASLFALAGAAIAWLIVRTVQVLTEPGEGEGPALRLWRRLGPPDAPALWRRLGPARPCELCRRLRLRLRSG